MGADLLIFIVAMLIGFIGIVTIDILGDVVCKAFPKVDKWLETMSGLEINDD